MITFTSQFSQILCRTALYIRDSNLYNPSPFETEKIEFIDPDNENIVYVVARKDEEGKAIKHDVEVNMYP